METSPEHTRERSSERNAPWQNGSGQNEERGPRERDQREHDREPEASQEPEPEERSEESSGPKGPSVKAIGWGFVLLILAGYFVWLCQQMGGGTSMGAAPMLGVLAASVVGIGAAAVAFLVGRGDKR